MRPAGGWKSIALGVGMIFLVTAIGCVVGRARISGGINEKQVQEINHGRTTQQQILDWFGQPDAVARQDGGLLHQPLRSHFLDRFGKPDAVVKQYYGFSHEPVGNLDNSEEFSGKTFLKLFSDKHQIGPQHMVYYYQHTTGGTAAGVWLDPIEGEVVIQKLWVLMDRETGKVEDHIFRKGSRKVQHDVLENP